MNNDKMVPFNLTFNFPYSPRPSTNVQWLDTTVDHLAMEQSHYSGKIRVNYGRRKEKKILSLQIDVSVK